jgi:hypothetical protein
LALITGCSDVKKDELVRTLLLVGLSDLNGVTGIAKFLESNPFDDPTRIYVQARNDSSGKHALKTS